MNRNNPRCRNCSGEDCVCCEVYLEDRENQRYQPDPADLEEELREREEFDRDEEEDEEQDEEQDEGEADQDREEMAVSDYENDTPFGQALADGSDE